MKVVNRSNTFGSAVQRVHLNKIFLAECKSVHLCNGFENVFSFLIATLDEQKSWGFVNKPEIVK